VGIPVELPVRGGDMIIVAEAGKVTVDGEVNKSGVYELGRRMTVLGALAAAGGITYSAKIDEIEVVRDIGDAARARLLVDLEKISRGELEDVRLRDGDILIIPTDSGRRLTSSTLEGFSRIINFGVGGQYNVAQ
jgi:polysaccharide export outer membrane protein